MRGVLIFQIMSYRIAIWHYVVVGVLSLGMHACQHPSYRQASTDTSQQSVNIQKDTTVEAQLLATVKHAESLGAWEPARD